MRTVVIDGKEWEEQDLYCEVCGAHMGELYNFETGKFENPHNYEDYGDNECPKCGQKYEYIEGDVIVLSEEQKELLRKHAEQKEKK